FQSYPPAASRRAGASPRASLAAHRSGAIMRPLRPDGTPFRSEKGPGADPARPLAFLVTTTGCARAIHDNLGAPAYSYYYVFEALAPVLERFGTCRLVDRPESRLAFAAARARAEGYQPLHLSLIPPQEAYLSPELPNILFPFWEFPDIP